MRAGDGPSEDEAVPPGSGLRSPGSGSGLAPARAPAAALALALLATGGCAHLPFLARGLPSGPPPAEPPAVEAGRVPPPGPYAPGVDVLHYEVELALSDSAGWIAGVTTVRLALADPPPGDVTLDLTGLAVDRVRVSGDDVDFRVDTAAGRLHAPLPPAARPGDTLEVEVAYRGVPDDGLLLGADAHGRPAAFAENWPDRARFWFPSVDHPSDKASVAFTVHAPERWTVVANGLAVDPPAPDERALDPDAHGPPAGPRRTWRWEQTVPIPTYTMVVGAAEMVVDTVALAACGRAPASPRPDGCVAVTTWLFPPDRGRAAASFRRAGEMVDHYARLVGPYPYAKLAHVQSSTRYGGMENASAIFYSESALAEGRDIEGTVAHETAHQWFGDGVTESEWPHMWLSEGFASYFENLFFEHADGPAAFRARMEADRERYLASAAVDRPVLDPEVDDLFDLLGPNAYQKGAWVLHMLRGLVGDDAFFGGVRLYVERHRNGTALTDDLRRAVEETAGRPLGWFFDQWLTEPGYPVLRVQHGWDGIGGEANVLLHQEQAAPWPTFRLPVDLLLRWPGGERLERVEMTAPEQVFRFRVPRPLTEVVIDPGGWLLFREWSPDDGAGGGAPDRESPPETLP